MTNLVLFTFYLLLLGILNIKASKEDDLQILRSNVDQYVSNRITDLADIDIFFKSLCVQLLQLEVNYTESNVWLNNELTSEQTEMEPTVNWNRDQDKLYTLLMTDPDASRNRNNDENWLHWLVINIPKDGVPQGDILAPYTGPTPQADTGSHRYILLVFEQNNKIEFTNDMYNMYENSRNNFNIKNFMDNYQLNNVVAGNLFLVKHTENSEKQQ